MSIERLFFFAALGGLLLPVSASAATVKTLTCQPGHKLKVVGNQVWCEGSSTVWKPGAVPNCGSGKKVDVRTGADKCKTPVLTKKPRCKSGSTYVTNSGQDKCRTPPIGGPSKLIDPSCIIVVNGLPQPWLYKVKSGVDKCQQPGGGKVSSFPSNACMSPMRLRTDIVGTSDRCAISATEKVKSAVTLR